MSKAAVKPKKVAFIGASCTGKTTLVDALQKELTDENAVFVPEAARQWYEKNSQSVDFSEANQSQIQNLALENEMAASKSQPEIIICDRSVLDAAAYCHTMIGPESGSKLFEKVQHWTPTYSKIYLIDPTDVVYEQDAIRQESFETRQQLHEGFVDFLATHNIDYELLSGDTNERVTKVKAHLDFNE